MTDRELTQVQESINEAIEVFQTQKSTLTAREISIKSMLLALRLQIAEQRVQERSGSKIDRLGTP
jgi:hypothetical protein